VCSRLCLVLLLLGFGAPSAPAAAADVESGGDPAAPAEAPAASPSRTATADLTVQDEGRFLGPRYRWGEMTVLRRVLWDLVAIPANVDRWSRDDWLAFGAVAVVVGGLWFGGNPSPDVRLDHWLGVHVGSPPVWNDYSQPLLWAGIAVGGLGTWWWAAAHQRWDIAQGFSLMGEALAVTQIYHVTLKVLIGREGPQNGDGQGRVLGPFQALRYYPGGTPSGHAGTLYSLLGAGLAYFRPPLWVEVTGHVVAASLVVAHVMQHRHYLSESIWGATMGWSIGRWVVRHRASPEHMPGNQRQVAVTLLPLRGGLGVAVVARL
jgi:hypothetical protein